MKKIGNNHINQLLFLSTLLLVTISCTDHDELTGLQNKGTLIDLGEIPVSVEGHADFAQNEFQTAAYMDNAVFVATSDGLWKCNLMTKQWSRSGFAGQKVSSIFSHPTIEGKRLPELYPLKIHLKNPCLSPLTAGQAGRQPNHRFTMMGIINMKPM